MNYHHEPEINSLEDLVTKSGHQLVLREGTASVNYFRNAMEWPQKQIWEKLLDKNSNAYVKTFEEAEQGILNKEGQVYFDINSIIEPIFDNYPCNIIRLHKTYFHRSVALALQKHSPYLNLFGYNLRHYMESGIIANTETAKKNPKGMVTCSNDEMERIGYKTIFSAFVVFGAGLVLAIIYCILEYYFGTYYIILPRLVPSEKCYSKITENEPKVINAKVNRFGYTRRLENHEKARCIKNVHIIGIVSGWLGRVSVSKRF